MRIWSPIDLLRLMMRLTPHGADMPIRKFAKLLNLTDFGMHDLLRGKKRIGKKLNFQLTNLENFLTLLGDTIIIEYKLVWLEKLNKAFDGQRPIDMLRTVKGYKELVFMIDQINSGAFQ